MRLEADGTLTCVPPDEVSLLDSLPVVSTCVLACGRVPLTV